MIDYKLCNKYSKKCSIKFYIFKGERLWNTYIKNYKPWMCMAMQKRGWMICICIQGVFLSFFKKYILGGVFFTNQHLRILNGHDNHVTLKQSNMHKSSGQTLSPYPPTNHMFFNHQMYLISIHLKHHLQRSGMQVCLEAITWNQTKSP